MTRWIRRAALACAAVCLLSLGAVSTATAATLSIVSDELRFSDPAAEVNNVSVSRNDVNYVVTDTAPITANAPCANLVPTVATCPVSAVTDQIDMRLGGGGDEARLEATIVPIGEPFNEDVIVEGGAGDDVLRGAPNAENRLFGHTGSADGPGVETLTGGSRHDELFASDGVDTVSAGGDGDLIIGGDGNDNLVGGGGDDFFTDTFFADDAGPDGTDVFDGGGGLDSVQFSRTEAVSLTLNGVADDGEGCPGAGCEGDNILPTVENIGGGEGNDRLIGNGSVNSAFGSGGNDVIDVRGGDDSFLNGGEGRDVILAGTGNDIQIQGGEDEDRLFGGGGDDAFNSFQFEDEPDLLDGGKGIDLVDYSGASGAVKVSLDGRANDGVAGENDNVRADVEDVTGTPEDDVLIGSKRPNDLVGGDGDDRLSGKGSLDGLSGGRGNDRLSGGKNRDLIEGDAGRDRIAARDGGLDQVSCGSSFDLVLADRSDRTAADCDRVKRKKRR